MLLKGQRLLLNGRRFGKRAADLADRAKGPIHPSLGRSPRTGVVMDRGLKARAMFGRIADVATWIPVIDGSGFQPCGFPTIFLGLLPRLG